VLGIFTQKAGEFSGNEIQRAIPRAARQLPQVDIASVERVGQRKRFSPSRNERSSVGELPAAIIAQALAEGIPLFTSDVTFRFNRAKRLLLGEERKSGLLIPPNRC
jgi:hypothetical protein